MTWLLVVACGGSSGDTSSTTAAPATSIATTTTTTEAPTTTLDGCEEATSEAISTFGVIFDRIDADPAAVSSDTSLVQEIGFELGQLVGTECGGARSGAALSAMLVYFADEATTRPFITAGFISGLLEGICSDPPVELTVQGRAACAGTG
jgi:hypothetical protein